MSWYKNLNLFSTLFIVDGFVDFLSITVESGFVLMLNEVKEIPSGGRGRTLVS